MDQPIARSGVSRVWVPSRLRWDVLGIPAATVVLIAIFGLLNPRFAELSNAANLGRQLAPAALVAWGQTLVILTAGIDLSVGSVAALVSVVTASIIIAHGELVGILAGIGVGLAMGVLNGLTVAALGLPPFVTTLATMSIAGRRPSLRA